MNPADEEPPVIGGGQIAKAPMPTEQDAWMAAYVARMVERGIDAEDAWACCRAGEHDFTDDPADAADEEMTYWDDDGDLA